MTRSNSKMELLKEYMNIINCDKQLWVNAETDLEGYLQQELRRLIWLVMDAPLNHIKNEIAKCRERIL